jgi:protein phosphatase inhibitor 2
VPPPTSGTDFPTQGLGVALGATQANTAANAGDVFADSDEEMDDEARARHAEFRGKMKKHYSNEAVVAMREARKLLEQEEDEEEAAEGENGDIKDEDGEAEGGKPNGNMPVEMA